MVKRIVSECLLGIKCRHDGKSKPNVKVIKLLEEDLLIPVCPEQLGGLPTPREAREIERGSGREVLDGKCRVMDKYGGDSTKQFICGAYEVLGLAKRYNIREAILKQRSPSCGSGQIYDGSFSGKIIEEDGVTTALLKKQGIRVISEEEFWNETQKA